MAKKKEAPLGTGGAQKTRQRIKKSRKKTSTRSQCLMKGMDYDQTTGKCK